MTLSAPAPGATFTSTLSMAAAASDNRGVSKVEFWFDGARVSRDTTAPYTATFTAGRATSYGVHTVSVRAFDAAGQRALDRRHGDARADEQPPHRAARLRVRARARRGRL